MDSDGLYVHIHLDAPSPKPKKAPQKLVKGSWREKLKAKREWEAKSTKKRADEGNAGDDKEQRPVKRARTDDPVRVAIRQLRESQKQEVARYSTN